MKKIVLVLAVLMVTSPAWAVININCVPSAEPNLVGIVPVDITYTSSEPNKIRAFGLNLYLDDPCAVFAGIVEGSVDPNYYIHPGTFDINEQGIVQGTPIAPPGYPDTEPGPGTGGMTLEMASLYVGEANAPGNSGVLCTVLVDGYIGDCNLIIAANVSRAGDNGVVMENPDDEPTVNLGTCLIAADCWCLGDTTTTGVLPQDYHNPGILPKDGTVDIYDLTCLAQYIMPTAPQFIKPTIAGYECLDVTTTGQLNPPWVQDGFIDIYDATVLAQWLQPTSPQFTQPCLPLE
jgi:hypothetical protein